MDLNLLPSQAKFQAAKIKLKKRVMFFVWIFSGMWAVLVLTVFTILIFNQINLKNAEKKLTIEQNQYKTMSEDAVLSYQIKYQAKLVGKVLLDRFEYGKSIEKINNIFPSNVVMNNYKITNLKQFILDMTAPDGKSMDEVEKIVKAINRGEMEDLESAKINSISIENDGWKFIMEVKIK
jgi:hypothetical protein